MSYTILTIPFNLKEKSEGEFLKKGFVVDDLIKIQSERNSGSEFFKILQFSDELIKCSITKHVLKKNNADLKDLKLSNHEGKLEINLIENPVFISKTKYLPSISGFYKLIEPDISKEEEKTLGSNKTKKEQKTKSDLKKLADTVVNDLKFYTLSDTGEKVKFNIVSIKLVLNRPDLIQGLGFGYFVVQLEWFETLNSANDFVSCLSSISNFYRWINNKHDSKTMFYHESFEKEIWNRKLDKKAAEISLNIEKLKITVENKSNQGLFLHDVLWEMMQEFFKIDDYQQIIYFNNQGITDEEHEKNQLIKPYVLHLCQTSEKLYSTENEKRVFVSDVYKSLRVPDSRSKSLNAEERLEFIPVNPDSYTEIYSISEGSLIIKGNDDQSRKKEMINDFYPAYLFALNQRQLFHYCQNRINSMELDENNRFKQNDIRKLRGMLVNAEFNQVFTSISNYHEIDSFYEVLRKNFNIGQLREEYISSIEGLQNIADLANEKESKQREDKLNKIILFLTIAQVWSGISSLFNFTFDWIWYINLIVYAMLAVLIVSTFTKKKWSIQRFLQWL
jgi:hypothetical protein